MRFAVTGPRKTTPPWFAVIRATIADLEDDVAEFSQGAQLGADTDAWRAALAYHPEALARAVVPVGMPHNERMVRMMDQWEALDNGQGSVSCEVVRVEPGERDPGGWLYLERNRRLLDYADVLLAFPKTSSEERVGSGTWACVREARRRGIEVRVFPLDGSPPWVEPAS